MFLGPRVNARSISLIGLVSDLLNPIHVQFVGRRLERSKICEMGKLIKLRVDPGSTTTHLMVVSLYRMSIKKIVVILNFRLPSRGRRERLKKKEGLCRGASFEMNSVKAEMSSSCCSWKK